MEPVIHRDDRGHNPPCFALQTDLKSVLFMGSFGPFGAVCLEEPKHVQAEACMYHWYTQIICKHTVL